MTDMEERRRGNAFERHDQTGLTLVVAALIVWVGSATQKTQIKVAELTVQVNHLKNVIRQPEARVNDLSRRIDSLERLHRKTPYD